MAGARLVRTVPGGTRTMTVFAVSSIVPVTGGLVNVKAVISLAESVGAAAYISPPSDPLDGLGQAVRRTQRTRDGREKILKPCRGRIDIFFIDTLLFTDLTSIHYAGFTCKYVHKNTSNSEFKTKSMVFRVRR
jgi:hypothetical protein